VIDLNTTKWTRPNTNEHSKMRYNIAQKLFDGDDQLEDDFKMRELWTIEKAIYVYDSYIFIADAEEIYKKNLEIFKAKCAKGDVTINLSTVSEKLFYRSEDMHDFWRVAFRIHRGYETR
jgi:UPF0288 family protein (methanogenesis marker protein 3)